MNRGVDGGWCKRQRPIGGARARPAGPPTWALLALSVAIHLTVLLSLPPLGPHLPAPTRAIMLSVSTPPPPAPEPRHELAAPLLPPPIMPAPHAAAPPAEPALKPVDPSLVLSAPGSEAATAPNGSGQPASLEPSAAPPAAPPGAGSTHKPPPAPKLEPAPQPGPAPQPAPAQPQVDAQALLTQYAAGVKAAILAQKFYPPAAERLGQSGSVKVSFSLDAGGGLAGVSVKSSSGFDELDNAALDAVRRAAPFPAIPTETGRNEMNLSITLTYMLN